MYHALDNAMAHLTVFVPFRVSPDEATALTAAAKSQRTTRSNVLRQLVHSLSSKTQAEEKIEPCQVS